MNIEIKDKTYELDLGIGFALNLDSKFKLKHKIASDLDVEFGLGVQMLYGQLTSVSVQAIVDFFNAALSGYSKKAFTQKELQIAIQDYAKDLGGFDKLADKCIDELKNVGLYPHIFQEEEENEM